MKSTFQQSVEIVIIGAGAGGASTALALAKLGHRITLLDAHDRVGLDETKPGTQKAISTSWINPGRAGHGFHYIDLATGKMLMESTIGVYRKYPGIQIGRLYSESDHLKKGRYFITKNSLFPKEQILAVYAQLQEHYRDLIRKDPENEVLGHPDDFFRILKPEEYQEVVDVKQVDVGIETTEQLIKPGLLAQIIFDKVKEEKNITLLTASTVTQIRYGQDKPFVVILQDGRVIEADQVINCAWEGMEAIDQTLGLFDVSVKCTNRLKVLAVVELPEELYDQHSMFFCMGAFCMFSNCGNGVGVMTYAPVTNVANYEHSKIDEIGRKFLAGAASPTEVRQYGECIIQGVAKWIPAMKKARLNTVRFGVVKTYGDVDIFDPRSAVHSRDYFGVDCKQIGYIGNACMKLMNLEENAKLVVDLFAQNLRAEAAIKELANELAQGSDLPFTRLLKLFLEHYLRRQYLPKDFESKEKTETLAYRLATHVKNKSALSAELSLLPFSLLLSSVLGKKLPTIPAKIVADYCEDMQSEGSFNAKDAFSFLHFPLSSPSVGTISVQLSSGVLSKP